MRSHHKILHKSNSSMHICYYTKFEEYVDFNKESIGLSTYHVPNRRTMYKHIKINMRSKADI